MAAIALERVRVVRGDADVLHGIDLHIADGERVAVVGPSGAGKTTLLRAIAGLERVEDGRVRLDGRDVTHVRPRDRDLAMVFEDARLLPDRDIAANLAFPLLGRLSRADIDVRVREEAASFSIGRLLRRRPHRVSSGERATAATARAFVRSAAAVLVDEPLVGIDPHRRAEALRRLREINVDAGRTMLVATNDQQTAALLGQRIVVLGGGRIRQIGTYEHLLRAPVDATVATAIGRHPMNLLDGRVVDAGHTLRVRVAGGELISDDRDLRRLVGRDVTIGIRSGAFDAVDPRHPSALRGQVEVREYSGAETSVQVRLTSGERVTAVVASPGPERGETVALIAERFHVFDRSGRALLHLAD